MAADPGKLTWKCYDCNMTFGNPSLLQKHKARFCVGGQLGDPELLLLRKGFRDEEPPPPRKPPEDYERAREGGKRPHAVTFAPRRRPRKPYVSENDAPRYNPHHDPKVQQLAESHGRQMEYLQGKNRDLERQREEIRRRLEELGRRPPEKDNTSEELLQQLREQEARNQRLLNELKLQLADARRPVNVVQEQPEKKSFIYPVYYGNSLVAEIVAVRQAYLQNGGNDPDILAQLAQMQAEAQAIDDNLRNAQKRQPKDKKDGTSNLMTMELENERLQRQLLLLQEQKIISTNRRKDNREDELEREIQRMHKDHLRKMYDLQRELERMRQEAMVERMRLEMQAQQQPARIIVQQPPQQQGAQRPYVDLDSMAPYDQYAGFVIFYDFVLNLDPSISAVRLVVGLHNLASKLGEPSFLPLVYTEPSAQSYVQSVSNAVIGARQPVPRCPPQSDMGIVAELQAAGAPGSNHDPTRLITRAWTKIPLFDGQGRLFAGRFRLQLRCSPIKPFIPFGELDSVAQYGDAELYYRIVHYRDASLQSMATIAAANRDMYQAAPVAGFLPQFISPPSIPPPPSTTPPDSPPEFLSPRRSRLSNLPRIGGMNSTEPIIGFQVDRVKHSDLGEGKVRLTAYYASTGKVVQSSTSAVTCSTTAVKANFKHGYHVFGQQEATFHDVELQGDMLLIARFYLKKRPQDALEDAFLEPSAQEATLYDEESLVAWTAMPLVLCADNSLSARARRDFDGSNMKINTGTKTLKLFAPPVPEPTRIPLQDVNYNREWRRFRNATLRVHIFQGQPRPGSLTPSDVSDDNEEVLPENAWLPMDRRQPPLEPFYAGDGFDVYIDGCRYLPDSVTFTRVAGRMLDRRYDVYGKDISTSVKLDSDIFNPVYEHKEEMRDPNIPPSATLLLKVYTIDNYYRQLTVVGYATLNVFVETGTEKQPRVDSSGIQVSLNEGCHQLRLFNQGPNGVDPFTESCLREANIRIVPCASLLVRLYKVPRGPKGQPLESSKVPQADWPRLGLWHPRPKYSDRIYLSEKCAPLRGETKLFHALLRRRPVTVRESVALNAKAKDSFLKSDKNMEQYVRNQLTKSMDSKPLDQDLNFIAQYSPRHGVKGTPHATYDKLTFTEKLDPRSSHTSPAWRDGYKHFPRRSFHRFLTAIIHLQEIFVSSTRDNYKYGLLEQAWTAVQVFKDKYAFTATFQLPLFSGTPTQQMLKQMAREPCKEWLERNIRSNTIRLIEGASIFVRLCDARRDDELIFDAPTSRLVEINTDYVPRGLEAIYTREKAGRPIESLIPHGKNPDQFMEGLATKFKSLVYKLYEEGNVGTN